MKRLARGAFVIAAAIALYVFIVACASGCASASVREPSRESPCVACYVRCSDGHAASPRQHKCAGNRMLTDALLIERERGEQGAHDSYIAGVRTYNRATKQVEWQKVARYSVDDIEFMSCEMYKNTLCSGAGSNCATQPGEDGMGRPTGAPQR